MLTGSQMNVMRPYLRGRHLLKRIDHAAGQVRREYADQVEIKLLKKTEVNRTYTRSKVVKNLYANHVGIHAPIQDSWAEAEILFNGDVLLGVFDGYFGTACSRVVAKRLFQYITVSLLPRELLTKFIDSLKSKFNRFPLYRSHLDKYFFMEDYRDEYEESLRRFAEDSLRLERELGLKDALAQSYLRLDEDLSREALADDSLLRRLLWVGMTGTSGTMAHLSDSRLTTATVGDALVVVGKENGKHEVLTPEHNIENSEEVLRILKEHPGEEDLIKNGLLYGEITSFRSFGNFRYKWKKETLEEKAAPYFGSQIVPTQLKTPPYLSAMPDVREYQLQPEDSFVVVATDGIWDVFPPSEVVEMILAHKPKGPSLRTKLIESAAAPLNKARQVWQIMRKTDKKELKDIYDAVESPATHVLLEAMDRTRQTLKAPVSYSHWRFRYLRHIRDDMTILVAYLNKDYLKGKGVKKEPEKTTPAAHLAREIASQIKDISS